MDGGTNGLRGALGRLLGRGPRPTPLTDHARNTALPLRVSGVKVSFGGVTALQGTSLEVRRGEIVGLIGPNGSGKTTLMDVISGFVRPTAGSVQVFGQEVLGSPPASRAALRLSRSFQDATLFPSLTVLQAVEMAARTGLAATAPGTVVPASLRRPADPAMLARVKSVVQQFGLVEHADTLTGDLSTGTRRVCDLAMQVAAAPALLLLDEPTAGVSQAEAEAFGPLVRRLRDDLDCAILLIEHDMPLLMGLCDRIYALEVGRVLAEGTPQEVREDPRVVASYLGTSTVAVERTGPASRPGPGTPRPPRPRATPPRTGTPAVEGADGAAAAAPRTRAAGASPRRTRPAAPPSGAAPDAPATGEGAPRKATPRSTGGAGPTATRRAAASRSGAPRTPPAAAPPGAEEGTASEEAPRAASTRRATRRQAPREG